MGKIFTGNSFQHLDRARTLAQVGRWSRSELWDLRKKEAKVERL